MAATPPHVWYLNFGNGSSTGYYALTQWATGTAKTVGNIVRQNTTPAVGSERCFICIVAGNTHATTEPTWVLTKGAKTTDNTVTWMECTGQPGVNGDVTNTPASSTERSQAVALGLIIKNNAADHLFICTTAGTCGASEPSYNTTTGATTTDNTAVWTCIGTTFGKWAAPFARLQSAWTTNWAAAGDTVYSSSIHAETQSTAMSTGAGTTTTAPSVLACISQSGNIPPTSADLTTGASITTTGNNAMTLGAANCQMDILGIAFSAGSGAVASTMTIGGSNAFVRMKNCSLAFPGTGAAAFSITGQSGYVELNNTNMSSSGSNLSTWSFANNTLAAGPGMVWRDSTITFSTAPTVFIGGLPSSLILENVDLSSATGTQLVSATSGNGGRVLFSHCKMPSLYTGATHANPNPGMLSAEIVNCDNGSGTVKHERWNQTGQQTTDASVIRTGGASDGVTGFSWKMLGFQGKWPLPFEAMPIVVWNSTTGSNVTVTVYGIVNDTALPKNDEMWIAASYMATSGSVLGTRVTAGKADFLASGSSHSADTSAWDSQITARQNSHAYSSGDMIKVATNPGRVFICTASTGSSASSEPAGYASAVDGGTVTDGSTTWRAMVRFKMTLTLATPQNAGYVYIYVRGVKASTTYWIDPLSVLT